MDASYLPIQEQILRFRAALEQNKTLLTVLERAASMKLPGWYLAAGALRQTVWNVVTNQDPEQGIEDYDLVYYNSSDLSWEAEDAIIQAGRSLFADIPIKVEIRNQARVHLWYESKFGVSIPPYESTEAAISTNNALFGVRLLDNGEWSVFAPWGFSELFSLVVRPNKHVMKEEVYHKKVARWKQFWPGLTVIPW
ncbi:hypothetical protein ACJ41O_009302 [Fusarium nematophilum]